MSSTQNSSGLEESDIKAQEQIVATLCAEAPSDAIRNCLRKYVPSKQVVQITATVKQEKKQVLVETLAYLGVPDMEQYKAEALPHELVCRIQNLFPDICHLCSKSYCVKLHEKPIISCARCGQGCHNECFLQRLGIMEGDLNEENDHGISLLNPHAAVGLIFFCGFCQKHVVPQKENLKIKAASKKKPELSQNQRTTTTINKEADQPQTPAVDQIQEDHVETEDASQEESEVGHILPVNQNRAGRVVFSEQNRSVSARNECQEPNISAGNMVGICRFYKQGRCRHGISGKKDGTCKFSHPKPCQKFLTNGNRRQRGCTKNERCKFFHPIICKSSLIERTCIKEDCKYLHIKGKIPIVKLQINLSHGKLG